MPDHHIATYLNDHLAGSVVALELLEHLEKAHRGSELERFLQQLREDIVEDRRELEALMARLNVKVSITRQAMAWLAEKGAQLKLRLDDVGDGAFRLLEAIEAVAVGIEGKHSLWRALAAASEGTPRLQGPDYGRLEQRADEQRRRVETVRLDAARKAFTS